jgi:hypothetical protein
MDKSFEERKRNWWQWHSDNPQVWLYFERFAFEAVCFKAVCKGKTRISPWLIINRIRCLVSLGAIDIVTNGADFKISNDYIAFYARLWRARHPEYADLFHIKPMLGETND